MKQALVVIDAQQELIDGNEEEQGVYQKDKLIDAINGAIKQALGANALLIFVRDKDVAGGKGSGFQVHSGIKVPDSGVQFFDKEATNSFYKTGLLSYLQENSVDHLVVMGCKTEHCIDTAVRTATVNGMDVTLVGDGHSTNGSSVLSAENMIVHHNQLLHGHYNVDHFSIVRQVQERLFEPTHNDYR